MALATSSLSQVCKGIRQYLDATLNGPTRSKVTVTLATPSETATGAAHGPDHYLNLFFFRFEPAGLFPDTLPGETGWLRSFCLVTPFAAEEGKTGAGENDLRLLGEVIRIFHEKPVFRLAVEDEALGRSEEFHLQVIYQPLALDQLNQLWSTQGDTIYRPSALYEISLAPVLPAVRAVAAPLAGDLGFAARAEMTLDGAAVPPRSRELPVMTPAIGREDWAPAIAFVHSGHCALSLGFALGSPELAAFSARVWLAGKPGEPVDLRWETWDAATGWQKVEPPTDAVIASPAIDPEAAAGAVTTTLALPFKNHVGQLLLYAERSYTRRADGVTLSVRSNPLLISLFAG